MARILRRIEAEVATLREARSSSNYQPSPEVPFRNFRSASSAVPPRLDALLKLNGEEFIEAAYQVLLRRPADAQGSSAYLDALRSGRRRRIDILGALRYSPEGRRAAVHVPGLAQAFAISRFWLLVRSLLGMPHADSVDARLAAVEGTLEGLRLSNALERLDRLEREVRLHGGRVESVEALVQTSAKRLEALAGNQEQLQPEIASVRASIDQLRASLAALAADAADLKQSLSHQAIGLIDQQRRMARLLDESGFGAERLSPVVALSQPKINHQFDSLFADFADRFRGTREDVKRGCLVYVPLAQRARETTACSVALDLACGRGEWLEVARETGLAAIGVDVNRVLVEFCNGIGLDARLGDTLEFLRAQPDSSASVITSFHLVEHVPTEYLIALLDESVRVLKPGGVMIVESPNVRNLLVGSTDFHRDPTHLAPVFPDTLEWLGARRGFCGSAAYFFDEGRTRLLAARGHTFDELNSYLQVSRDFAWVGTKE